MPHRDARVPPGPNLLREEGTKMPGTLPFCQIMANPSDELYFKSPNIDPEPQDVRVAVEANEYIGPTLLSRRH